MTEVKDFLLTESNDARNIQPRPSQSDSLKDLCDEATESLRKTAREARDTKSNVQSETDRLLQEEEEEERSRDRAEMVSASPFNRTTDAPTFSEGTRPSHCLMAETDETRGSLSDNLHRASDNVKDRARETERTIEDRAHHTKESIKEDAHNAKESIKDGAHNAKESIRENTENARSTLSEKWEATKEKVEDLWEKTKAKAEDIKDAVKDKMIDAKDTVKDKTIDAKDAVKDKTEEVHEGLRDRMNNLEIEEERSRARERLFDSERTRHGDVIVGERERVVRDDLPTTVTVVSSPKDVAFNAEDPEVDSVRSFHALVNRDSA